MKAITAFSLAALCAAASAQTNLYYRAPQFSPGHWFNTSKPIQLAKEKGKVVVLFFWTFECINCKHTLPAIQGIERYFRGHEVQVLGIHSPETSYEVPASHLAKAIRHDHIDFPVLQDNNSRNWNRYHQQFWPTVYVIDKNGFVRGRWVGELNYGGVKGEAQVEKLIQSLL